MTEHRYQIDLTWTGNRGTGTSSYRAYGRDHEITAGAKPMIPGSADSAFRGDPGRWNPEELLVASLAACHKLWYLHLAAEVGIVVVDYRDQAAGTMQEMSDGGGQFVEVTLNPVVTITAGDAAEAHALYHKAHEMCFIARSVNFPVDCVPTIRVAAADVLPSRDLPAD